MDFQKHTSEELVTLFNNKPFQGQSPEKAKIIFLSSDANYSPEISNNAFFEKILEYQKDGVAFWEKYGCHHPFLLPSYPYKKSEAGVPFHRNFSKVGLTSKHAVHVSFLELLDIPTIGNKSQNKDLFYQLVSQSHLEYIENLMTVGGDKLFFVSNGVLKDIEKIKKTLPVFEWFDFKSGQKEQYSKEINGNRIQEIYHFSSSQIHGQIAEISTAIESWLTKDHVQNLMPAELFHVLYSRMSDPAAFGDSFAADERNSIICSRLTNSFSQEIIRLLMSCVRADAERRGENVEDAIDRASATVRSTLEEAKQLKGNYRQQ